MKGSFNVYPNLMTLEETLKKQEPYAVINVSTTGLDNKDFDKHSPTRVCVQEYVWDEELKKYKDGLTFDKMVKCGEEALQEALKPGSYDVFENGGIDKEAYISGKDVLSQAEFKKEYDNFMDSLKPETMLVANNAKFVKTYLDKIDCGDSIQNKVDRYKLLDQTHMTKEYFEKNQIPSPKNTLEAMHDHLAGKECGKIIGGDNRIKVINDFITKHGRDAGILEDEMSSHFREETAQYYQHFVDSGVEKYRNADFDGKLETLLKKGVIDPEAVMDRNGDCDLNRLYDVLEGKNGNRGFTVMQAATTGFHAGNVPIQITAMAYELKDGVPEFTNKGISFNIQADKRSLQQAIKEAESGKFDAFKYTGIELDDYLSNPKVRSQEEALDKISGYFKTFSPDEFPIISNGTDRSGVSFSQNCLKSLGSLPAFDAPHIDFTQAIKEYCYLANTSDKYPQNAIIDISNYNEKTFGLEDVAKHNQTAVGNTKRKCLYVGMLVSELAEQQKEISKELTADRAELSDEEMFMEDDGAYSNIESFPAPAKNEEKAPQSENTEKTAAEHIQEAVSQASPVQIDVNYLIQSLMKQNELLAEQNKILTEQNSTLVHTLEVREQAFMKVIEDQHRLVDTVLCGEKSPIKSTIPMDKKEKPSYNRQLA